MDTPDRQRREFLLTLAAGGAGAVAALAGGRISATPAPSATAPETAGTKGYQASAHVQKYYRTLKL